MKSCMKRINLSCPAIDSFSHIGWLLGIQTVALSYGERLKQVVSYNKKFHTYTAELIYHRKQRGRRVTAYCHSAI